MKLLNQINNKNYIAGKWITGSKQIKIKNPATLEDIGNVPNLEIEDICRAIDSTVGNFKVWSNTSIDKRVSFLQKWHELIILNTQELANIITLEQGKIAKDAENEVMYGASFINWFAELISNIKEDVKTIDLDRKIITQYEPVGPVAAITPWNFPLAMITRKLSPALASGCSVLLKPSSLAPLTSLALLRLAEEAGLPGGVVNVITGDSSLIGTLICKDFRIRKISFTGSTDVGKKLYQNSSHTLKRISLELGGNAPFIVFGEVDIDKVVDDLVLAKTRSNGQSCTSPNRIFIDEKIYTKFTEILTSKFASLKLGIDFGPLINQNAIDKIVSLVNNSQENGAQLLCGGTYTNQFYMPTVLTECTDTMKIASSEIFGPIAACYKFSAVQEVVGRANNTKYGLQAYIYLTDLDQAKQISSQLDFGMIAINSPFASHCKAPFAGRKESGFGIEGGDFGIFEYLNTKYINLNS
ncbi:MAG: NAD-dependent succinate-semialdehyde dehydrogenase [Rickettsiaceae bacterium]|nr:MAG: NAD-dependent succinate-semialdehyde dehydrogenase [Rickettsiaceae bacterium]